MKLLLPLPLPLGLQISAIDNSLVKDLFRFLLHPGFFGVYKSGHCSCWIIGWAKYMTLGYQLRLKHLI
ncbi:hypothetical protein ES319_A11G324400v1 [Gossypium barbadense]|uniref:Uncharacterized protein n=2 Tax=Gossypium TaxID=3633 RepID=A0A5J5TVW9_GOSBA|nr:hypothetical protein ES319_A11G324400v1 [Gossypium barbadense]TYG96490.1 hypothetical protein ES288_A11G354600v1 [Gossypium darwinii]